MNSGKTNIKIASRDYKILDKTIVYRHKVKRYDNWYKIARNYNTNINIRPS